MRVEQREDGWWITNMPEGEDYGPYARKADAEDDRRGMKAFFENVDSRKFFTAEK
jgi:hypothetical protein